MELIFSPRAAKRLAKMPKRDATDLRTELDSFVADPLGKHAWAKAFGDGVFRIRQGDDRAVCEVNFGRVVVLVLAIGNRKNLSMSDTITLTRAEYDALLARVEDAEDLAAVAAHRARIEALGEDVAYGDFLPAVLVDRLIEGEHPVRIWRQHRGMTAAALAASAKLPAGYLSEIENRKKPGSLDAMRRLAAALSVPLDDLVPQIHTGR